MDAHSTISCQNKLNVRVLCYQEQLDDKDPSSQSYSEAIELIHSGASAEDLVRRGLRREEAELLLGMHGEQSLG